MEPRKPLHRWHDVDLTQKGEEARESGRLLKEAGFQFDVAYITQTSHPYPMVCSD